MTCKRVTYSKEGESCDGATPCLVGECPITHVPPGTGAWFCPKVIADGQPCDKTDSKTTCDFDAECINGTCVLGYPKCN